MNNNNNKRISSSSTSASSSASSSSTSPNLQRNPNSNININPRPATKTMEEVWKDINLFSLHAGDHRHPPTTTTAATNLDFRGMTLQDFLSRPFSRDPPPTTVVPAVYGSPAPPPPPATFLSLNSGHEHRHFHFLNNSDDVVSTQQNVQNDCPFGGSPFDVAHLASPPANEKKRFPEPERSSGDRRHKRMIKNRESAARSRARKQAYTNELELEVAHLLEENAKLRKQQERLCVAAAAQFPKKNSLHRTSTAPF